MMNPEGKFLSVTPAPITLCEQVMLMTRLFVQRPLCTCMFIINLSPCDCELQLQPMFIYIYAINVGLFFRLCTLLGVE